MNKMCSIEDYINGKGTNETRFCREVFLRDATFYQPFISKEANQVLNKSISQIEPYVLSGNQQAATLFHYVNSGKYAREQVNNQQIITRENKARTITKNEERRAGFINASILLYAILNIGIIIAVTLIIL